MNVTPQEFRNLSSLKKNITTPLRRKPPFNHQFVEILSCGFCDTVCIYTCLKLIFILGVFANVLMVSRVIKDKLLRSPTFIALASLAVADALFLLFHSLLNIDFIITKITCASKMTFAFKYLPGTLAMFWFSASFHVSLLAAMRYIVLVHPMKTLTLLTNKRIVKISISVWLVAGIIFGSFMVVNTINEPSSERATKLKIVTWCFTYFTPVVLTSILHIVKIIKVKKLSFKNVNAQGSDCNGNRKNSSNRMTRIIVFVILAGAILPLPNFVFEMLKDGCNIHIKDETIRANLHGIFEILFLLNFAINPFIYSFNSKTFRRSLRRMTSSSSKSTGRVGEQHTRTTPAASPVIQPRLQRKSEETEDVKFQTCPKPSRSKGP